MDSVKLWQYNKATGYFEYVRSCDSSTAAQWLEIFQKDKPDEIYRLSCRKPKAK